jgi:hypothetical protein
MAAGVFIGAAIGVIGGRVEMGVVIGIAVAPVATGILAFILLMMR